MLHRIRLILLPLLILPLVFSPPVTNAQTPATAAPRLVVFEGFFRPT